MDKSADCSNNLKGTVVRDLRKAAAITRASMTILSHRTAGGTDTELSQELNEMRSELAAMRRENVRLRLQLDNLRKKTGGKGEEDGITVGRGSDGAWHNAPSITNLYGGATAATTAVTPVGGATEEAAVATTVAAATTAATTATAPTTAGAGATAQTAEDTEAASCQPHAGGAVNDAPINTGVVTNGTQKDSSL